MNRRSFLKGLALSPAVKALAPLALPASGGVMAKATPAVIVGEISSEFLLPGRFITAEWVAAHTITATKIDTGVRAA